MEIIDSVLAKQERDATKAATVKAAEDYVMKKKFRAFSI
jgi:hypothetical protein